MERKIGEIFKVGDEWYQCVEQPGDYKGCACDICSMNVIGNCELDECSGNYRADKKSVIFKKLEKVGGPVIEKGRTFQCLKAHYMSCVECAFKVKNKACYKNTYIDGPCLGGNIWVEIKQNKENMKEKNSNQTEDTPLKRLVSKYINNKIKYSDFEKRVKMLYVDDEGEKLELIPFDLSKAKAGRKVYTRDGRKAVFLTTLSNKRFPVVAIVNCGQEENIYQYDINGICDENDDALDLMMLSEKKEGWVNVYNDAPIYDTKERAELGASTVNKRIGTFKISWEE